MSESENGGGAGNREVAYRLFAAEFDDADLSYSESDEERAPNYVVTPTGARVNRLFVVGVLTEVETVSEDYLRARVVDPTGPFVVYAGQYQPEALAFLDGADTPTFVAVTGKARTFQPEDSDRVYTSVRPESINEVDADARDRWVVGTAERTVDRVATAAAAIDTGLEGDALRAALEANGVDESLAAGLPIALDHYGTTGEYLAAVRELSLDAARVVAGEIDEVEPLTAAPDAGTDDPVPALIDDPIDVDAAELESEETDGDSGAPAADPDEDREPTGSATGTERAATDAATDGTESESASEAISDEGDGDVAAGDQTADAAESAPATTEPEADAETGVGDDETGATSTADEATDGALGAEGETDATTGAEGETEAAAEAEAETDAAADESATETDESLDDFDPEFELDEDEREEIESEFGTDFQSGSEVDEPGEADIETSDEPEPADETAETDDAETVEREDAEAVESDEDGDETAAVEAAEDEAAADATEDDAADDEGTEADDGGDATEDVDLEDAVVDVMDDLDEGDGADRDAVLDAVVDRTGADADEVDDAIQEALMGGRCYEPADDRLKPI